MRYIQKIEVEAVRFTESNIDEVLDFICDGETFEMCFVEDRETTKLDIIKKKKIYIEYPAGMITAYFGNYLVKISKNIFQVWSKEEFEKFHKIKLKIVSGTEAKRVVIFESYPCFYEKEKAGLKCNTVRTFELNDGREYILRDIIEEEIKKEDVILEIRNTETGETFQREISDVSKFEVNNIEIYIISWRDKNDEKQGRK